MTAHHGGHIQVSESPILPCDFTQHESQCCTLFPFPTPAPADSLCGGSCPVIRLPAQALLPLITARPCSGGMGTPSLKPHGNQAVKQGSTGGGGGCGSNGPPGASHLPFGRHKGTNRIKGEDLMAFWVVLLAHMTKPIRLLYS